MLDTSLDKAQTEIKIARRNISNLRCADDTSLMAESEEELRSFLIKVKRNKKQITSNFLSLKNFRPTGRMKAKIQFSQA